MLFVIFASVINLQGKCLFPNHSYFTAQNEYNKTKLIAYLRGAKIIAQDSDNTYLGKLASKYESDSVFNKYGTYGNKYSSTSIWNTYSSFGSQYSSYSPFNKFSTSPPMLVKDDKVIGYLTINKYVENSISPSFLKSLEDDF